MDLDKQALTALFNLTKALAESGQGKEARTYGQRYLDAAKPASAHQQDIAAIKKILEGIKRVPRSQGPRVPGSLMSLGG